MKSDNEKWLEVVRLFKSLDPQHQPGRVCMAALISAYRNADENFKESIRPDISHLLNSTLELFPEKARSGEEGMMEYSGEVMAECLGLSAEDAEFLFDEMLKGIERTVVQCE